MGVYYRLVNLETKEAIEPEQIGGGGIRHNAVVNGDASRLFAHLHLRGEDAWRLVGDDGYDGLVDATEKYREEFNKMYPDAKIERCHDDF